MAYAAGNPEGSVYEKDGSVYELQKTSYTHDGMIDILIQNPMISQKELARHFGYTEGWISRILRCDAFREQVAARKSELVDPLILATLEARFEALANRSMDVLMDKLDLPNVPADVACKALELSSRALGYGAQKAVGVQIQQNFVVAMPQKSPDSATWVESHSPRAYGVRPPECDPPIDIDG